MEVANGLSANTHISNVCTKANRTLGFLRRNLYSCPPDVKEAAYKGLVRPVLEYESSVWDPHTHGLQEELEKVQNRAARFVTGNYVFETGSMTGILGQLKWESLKKRRKDSRLILLYKGLKGKARIPADDLIPKNRRCRNQHSLAFQIPSASKEAYKSSFFPQTIRDWNDLPDLLKCLMTVCPSSLHSCVQGTNFSPSEPPGVIMSFGVSPVNYSDSDANEPGLEVIKLFSSSAQLSMKIQLVINVENFKNCGKFRFKTQKLVIYPAHKC